MNSTFFSVPLPEIDDCVNHTCANGGSCTDGINSYSCNCLVGFTGNYCQIGMLDLLLESFLISCVCTVHYFLCCSFLTNFGILFSLCADIDDCVNLTCANGGSCVDGVNSYSCSCVAGYTGGHCEKGAVYVQFTCSKWSITSFGDRETILPQK